MKKYYAKTKTAYPGCGLLDVGEVLTQKQAEALGEKLAESMVERGLLGVCGTVEHDKAPEPNDGKEDPSSDAANPDDETPDAMEPDGDEENGGEDDETDEPIELELTDDMVSDEGTGESPTSAAKGRRKAK